MYRNSIHQSMSEHIIEDVKPLLWGQSGETSFIASLANVMEAIGVETSYNELMVMSGAGFRMQISDDWCPSSGDWYDRSRTLHHLGYTTKNYSVRFEEVEKDLVITDEDDSNDLRTVGLITKDKAIRMIKESLISGYPVIGIDLYQIPEWGIITGFAENDFLIRDYFGGTGDEYVNMRKFPWIIHTISERETDRTKKEYLIEALRNVVQTYNTPKFDEKWNGKKGFEFWIKQLRNINVEDERYNEKWHLNGWLYDLLMDGRHSVYLYLKEWIDEFVGQERELLEQIQEKYFDIAVYIDKNWIYFPMPHWADQDNNRTFIPPFYGPDAKEPHEPRWLPHTNWTEEMRLKGADTLSTIFEMEEEAMGLIEDLLNAIENK